MVRKRNPRDKEFARVISDAEIEGLRNDAARPLEQVYKPVADEAGKDAEAQLAAPQHAEEERNPDPNQNLLNRLNSQTAGTSGQPVSSLENFAEMNAALPQFDYPGKPTPRENTQVQPPLTWRPAPGTGNTSFWPPQRPPQQFNNNAAAPYVPHQPRPQQMLPPQQWTPQGFQPYQPLPNNQYQFQYYQPPPPRPQSFHSPNPPQQFPQPPPHFFGNPTPQQFPQLPSHFFGNPPSQQSQGFATQSGQSHKNRGPPISKHRYSAAPQSYAPAKLTQLPPNPNRSELLIVLDLNGTLVDRKRGKTINIHPRPYLSEFLRYVFANHHVMFWTAAMPHSLDQMLSAILTDPSWAPQIVASWGRDTFNLTQKQFTSKTEVVKDLNIIWQDGNIQQKHPRHLEGGSWGPHNTVLVDDTEAKAKQNRGNLISVPVYELGNAKEEGELRVLLTLMGYLEALKGVDVVEVMKERPFIVR